MAPSIRIRQLFFVPLRHDIIHSMNPKVKKTVTFTVAFAGAAVLLYFAFRNIDWQDFYDNLKKCDFRLIFGVIAIQWLITYLRGNRWKTLMDPLNPGISRRETYDAYAICYLANIGFPRSGEVVRCGLIANTGKASFEGALGTVVIERTWDILCVFIITVPLLLFGHFRDFLVEKIFKPVADGLHPNVWVILGIALAAVITAVLVKRCRKKEADGRESRVLKFFKGLGRGIAAGFRMDRKWVFLGYTALIWALYWLCSLMTLKAFPAAAGMNGMDALFMLVVGSLGWMVPVQGGFGAYHFIITMALVPIYSFSYETGLVFATISHESQIVQMLLCGIVSLVSWTHYKRHSQKSAQ